MERHATNIDQMILQLNEFILPGCLMESFDAYRQEAVKDAARPFNHAQLSWFLKPDMHMPECPSITAQVSPSATTSGLLRGFMPPARREFR
jgi:hypothetical protein